MSPFSLAREIRRALPLRATFCALSFFFATALLHAAALPESEPNPVRAQATLIALAETPQPFLATGRISALSDIDYYKVTLPPLASYYALNIVMTPAASDHSLDAKIEIEDASGPLTARGTVIASRDAAGDNVPESISLRAVTGSTFYVRCASADLFSLGAGDYTLSFTLTELADTNDTLAEAINLGPLTGTQATAKAIDFPNDVTMYAIDAEAGQSLGGRIETASNELAACVRLFGSDGREVGKILSAAPGAALEFGWLINISGRYFLGISGAGNTSYDALTGEGDQPGSVGAYRLTISPGLSGNIRRAGDSDLHEIDLLKFKAATARPPAINPNASTWIVVHGWNSFRDKENIRVITEALAANRTDDQILTLDWSSAAKAIDPSVAENSIVAVAEWASSALAAAGFRGTNINLVGHSFGSYVADELARRLGGVNTITALDPAANIPGGFDPVANHEIDFGRDSNYSWSFHSSSLGSDETPFTADSSFIVNTGQNTLDAHGDVVFLFAYLLADPADEIAQYFFLSYLLGGYPGPWLPDQYASPFLFDNSIHGYEAVITADNSGTNAAQINFVPTPPKLAVSMNGIRIQPGDAIPAKTKGTDFGVGIQGQNGPAQIFTVTNDGGTPLAIRDIAAPPGFAITRRPTAALKWGESAFIAVQMETSATGKISGQLQISSSDATGPLAFAIKGIVAPNVGPRLAISRGPNHNTILSWDTLPEVAYLLQTKLAAIEATWIDLTNLTASASSLSMTNSAANASSQFYRIRVAP